MQLLDLEPSQLRGRSFAFSPVQEPGTDRISIFEQPRAEHVYVAGMDTAYGLPNRDQDALCILDISRDVPTQVAEVAGHWGERFHHVVYPMLCYYNSAFLVGERQGGGLFQLQRLWRDYGFRWQYFQRVETRAGRPKSKGMGEQETMNLLGHHKGGTDLLLRRVREAVAERAVHLRSKRLLDQMGRMMFVNKTEQTAGERLPDEGLRVRLVGGGSPDLVIALCYAWMATKEVRQRKKQRQPYADDTLGAIFGHNEREGLTKEKKWRVVNPKRFNRTRRFGK